MRLAGSSTMVIMVVMLMSSMSLVGMAAEDASAQQGGPSVLLEDAFNASDASLDRPSASSTLSVDRDATSTSGDFQYVLIENGTEVEIVEYVGGGGAVHIPDVIDGLPVTSTGRSAFFSLQTDYHITSITVPGTVTSIDGLGGSKSLESIMVSPDNPVYASMDGVLYDSSLETLIEFPMGRQGSLIVPDGVRTIDEGAFCCCMLTSVDVPDSVTRIDSLAFSESSLLESASIGRGVKTIENRTFRMCDSLESVHLSEGLTTIGDKAFYDCPSIESIVIPETVISIGEEAFSGPSYGYQPSLRSIVIPDNVKSLGYGAFGECDLVERIVIGNNLTVIPDRAFYDCWSLTSLTFGEGVMSIGELAFANCAIRDLKIPEGITSLGMGAFGDSHNLRSVTIPSSVRSMGANAFSNCDKLKSFTFPGGLTSIIDFTLRDCKALETVTVGANVTYIGVGAFDGCDSLKRIVFEGDAPMVDDMWLRWGSPITVSITMVNFEGSHGFGDGPWVDYDVITLNVPSAPRDLTVASLDGSVSLEWGVPTNDAGHPVIGYTVYRGTSSDSMVPMISGLESLSFEDFEVRNDERYYYRVTATNSNGEGLTGEYQVVVPTSGSTPSEPTHLTASAGDRVVELTWSPPYDTGDSPVTGYIVYRGGSAETMVPIAIVGDVTDFVDWDVVNGDDYHYGVRASNSQGEGVITFDVVAFPESEGFDQTKLWVAIVMIAIVVVGTGYVVWKGRWP